MHSNSALVIEDKYDRCGVCKMGCLSCDQVYVGQTVRSFKARYDEHISDITHNRDGKPFRIFLRGMQY